MIPVDGPEILDGTLVIQDGVIKAIGPRDKVKVPGDAQVINAEGRFIMPGLVDTHSHIGGFRAADSSGPIQPGARIMDGLNVFDAGYRRAVAGGLTTLNVMPGSGHLSSGQTIYLKMRRTGPGTSVFTPEDLAYTVDDGKGGRRVLGGLKMANGTNSQRSAPFPGTRAKIRRPGARKVHPGPRNTRPRSKRLTATQSKLPPRDLDLEILVEVMAGQRVVHHHTHRADDIMTVLRLKEEFGFQVVLHHLSEGWKVADQIAAAGVGCEHHHRWTVRAASSRQWNCASKPGRSWPKPESWWPTIPTTGSPTAVCSCGQRPWGCGAASTVRTAMKSLTLNGAMMLGLADRVGTLTPGKDADFIVLDGDPLSVYSRVQQTWVEGSQGLRLQRPCRSPARRGRAGGHSQTWSHSCAATKTGVSHEEAPDFRCR